MAKPLLSAEDLAAVEAAVRAAEAKTTGEIYCVAAEESSEYGETPLAWAAGVAILAPALLLMGGVRVEAPGVLVGWTAAQVADAAAAAARRALVGAVILQGLLFVVTLLVTALPAVRRALTPRALKRERVRARAREQFIAKNLAATRERTGVLIYVSFRERMAELIADEGVAEHVEPHAWDRAMAALTDGLKRGEAGAGFAAAVELCGEVLAQRFPARPGDNPDELPDAVVVIPRLGGRAG
jgi:putative membrane protein